MQIYKTKLDDDFLNKLCKGNLGQLLQYLREGRISKVEYTLEEDKYGNNYTKYIVTNICTEMYTIRNKETIKKEIIYNGSITYEDLWRSIWSKIINSFRRKHRVRVHVFEKTEKEGIINVFIRKVEI